MGKGNALLDSAALVVYLVAANPALTGVAVHEWLGLGVFAMFAVHVALHVDWLAGAVKGLIARPVGTRTGILALDALLAVALMVVMVSGLLVSGAVLPALGYYAQGCCFWDPLHAIAAKVLLALLVVHVAMHARQIVGWVKKGKGGSHDGRTDG